MDRTIPKNRSVVGLLPADSTDLLRDPVAIAIFAAVDTAMSQAGADCDGFVEVPLEMLMKASGEFMTLVMTLSVLPQGFAEMCGKTHAGETLMGSAFIDHMAAQEVSDRRSPEGVFYRFDASMLHSARDGFLARETY